MAVAAYVPGPHDGWRTGELVLQILYLSAGILSMMVGKQREEAEFFSLSSLSPLSPAVPAKTHSAPIRSFPSIAMKHCYGIPPDLSTASLFSE